MILQNRCNRRILLFAVCTISSYSALAIVISASNAKTQINTPYNCQEELFKRFVAIYENSSAIGLPLTQAEARWSAAQAGATGDTAALNQLKSTSKVKPDLLQSDFAAAAKSTAGLSQQQAAACNTYAWKKFSGESN